MDLESRIRALVERDDVDIDAVVADVLRTLTREERRYAVRTFVHHTVRDIRRRYVRGEEHRSYPKYRDHGVAVRLGHERRREALAKGYANVTEMSYNEAIKERARQLGYESVEAYHDDGPIEHVLANMQHGIEQIVDDRLRERLKPLLRLEFALADGSRVTWGRATLADHKARLELMEKLALAVTDDMVLHQQVVNILQQTGATCLRQALRKAA